MKDYWSQLKINECWSPRQKFNKVMAFVDENLDTPITEDNVVDDTTETIVEEQPVSTGDVQVSVIDEDEEKIGGVSVTLTLDDNEYTGTTGKAGGCTIRDVPYGEYEFTAVKEGYIDETGTISVDDETVELNITLVSVVDEPIDEEF